MVKARRRRLSPNTSARPPPDEAPSENRGVEPASPGLPSQSVASGEDTPASTNLTGEVLGSHAPSPEETPQDGQARRRGFSPNTSAPADEGLEDQGVEPASPGLPSQSVAFRGRYACSTNLTGEVLGSHAPSPGRNAARWSKRQGRTGGLAEHFGAPAPR